VGQVVTPFASTHATRAAAHSRPRTAAPRGIVTTRASLMRPRSMSTLAALSGVRLRGPAAQHYAIHRRAGFAVGSTWPGSVVSRDRRSCSLLRAVGIEERGHADAVGGRVAAAASASLVADDSAATVGTGRVDRSVEEEPGRAARPPLRRRLRHTVRSRSSVHRCRALGRLHLVLERIDQRRGRVLREAA